MKSALLLLSGTAFAALSFLSVTYAASAFIDDGETHDFRHIGEPLWKSEPTYLDRGNMTLTQVEARYGRNPTSPTDIATPATAAESEMGVVHTASAANPAHLDWCMARYRSYDSGDNTYQPYGGSRRTCESPYGSGMPETASAEMPIEVAEEASVQQVVDIDAAAWCRQQYRSYRASDNTYQPFSGPRQVCVARAF